MYEDSERVIANLRWCLSKGERYFSTTERECRAVWWAVEKLRPKLRVVTDHYFLIWLIRARLAR